MGFSIQGNIITLTRGDTLKALIEITDADGSPYNASNGDTIRFAAKKSYDNDELSLLKYIPTTTMMLVIDPEDTKSLNFGTYVYDIQITKSSGEVDTFIKGKLKLTEEVD